MKVAGVVGFRNAGKTVLVERLVRHLTARGFRVSTVKHAHHSVDLDTPGKDSWRHRAAGARQVILSSRARWALFAETGEDAEPSLAGLLARLDPVDLVIVEGYKRDRHPKIEVSRAAAGHPLIAPDDPTVIAVAADGPRAVTCPVIDIDDIPALADAMLAAVGLTPRPDPLPVVVGPDVAPGGNGFDAWLMVDWSGGNDRGARPVKDAIWACLATPDGVGAPVYLRNRQLASDWIARTLTEARAQGWRVAAGFDFPFACPAGFAKALTGVEDPLALWDWLAARVQDAPDANNRFDIAGAINAAFPGIGPFWGNGLPTRDIPHLPRKGNDRTFRWDPPRRACERLAPGAFEVWQLAGAGAVGSQMLLGLPVLAQLRQRFGADLAVWPLEPSDRAGIVLMEIWPSLLRDAVRAAQAPGEVPDAAQVRVLAAACRALTAQEVARLLARGDPQEGWILGAGDADILRAAAGRGGR